MLPDRECFDNIGLLCTGILSLRKSSLAVWPFSIEDRGLGNLGVPSGVALGVGDALSALIFLAPDLGVMFELKRDFTGVATLASV